VRLRKRCVPACTCLFATGLRVCPQRRHRS
jgi:hypothetical protein